MFGKVIYSPKEQNCLFFSMLPVLIWKIKLHAKIESQQIKTQTSHDIKKNLEDKDLKVNFLTVTI
jgi:hypothetical protein